MKLAALLLLAATAAAGRAPHPARGRGAASRPPPDSLLAVATSATASASFGAEVGSRRSLESSEPQTLEQYCQKGEGKTTVGTKVDADWMGLGEKYPGEISNVNKDGTVDIAYDDGFEEKNVPMERVKVAGETVDKKTAKTDPACELQDFTKKLKDNVVNVRKEVGKWIEDKTKALMEAGVEKEDDDKGADEGAKRESGKASAPAEGKDPGKLTANATEVQSEELERLKKQLDSKDVEIQELEKELRETDDQIEEGLDKDGDPMTMDELIAMYRARIERRDRRIEELKARLDKRRKKLEEIRDPESDKKDHTTLEDIFQKVEDLSKEIDMAREKRARLRAEGKMDPELDHTLEGIFRMQEDLENQLRELERLQSRVQEQKEAARRAAKKAEADAREEAEKVGDSPDVVEAKALRAREDASKESDDMDRELLKKARDVSEDLDKVQRSAQVLDSGVIPNGEKWWRYRYEHAYVEAVLMIMVCLLMLIWERIYQFMRWKVRSLSNADDDDKITHGTMYIGWLEFLAGELMTSLLVFLTCWVLSELGVFGYFPMLLQGAGNLHLPNRSYEYRRLCLDVCVVFFFAIIFYYTITLSVVIACTKKLETWALFEEELMMVRTNSMPDEEAQVTAAPAAVAAAAPASSEFEERRCSSSSRTMRVQQAAVHAFLPRTTLMGKTDTEAKHNYGLLKAYFFAKVSEEPALVKAMEDEELELSAGTFPFWIYIRLAVRRNSDKLFQFGLPVWACLIAVFFGLLFLHRFAHMGCVRVLFAVNLVLAGVFLLMVWWINKIVARVTQHAPAASRSSRAPAEADAAVGTAVGADKEVKDATGSFHQQFSTEAGVIGCLHVLLFFTCYLAARMICQPWMWRLHFWLVLSLTVMLILLGAFFVLVVAPMIPDFLVALAMPPYVDPSDVKTMMEAVNKAAVMDVSDLQDAIAKPEERKVMKAMSQRILGSGGGEAGDRSPRGAEVHGRA